MYFLTSTESDVCVEYPETTIPYMSIECILPITNIQHNISYNLLTPHLSYIFRLRAHLCIYSWSCCRSCTAAYAPMGTISYIALLSDKTYLLHIILSVTLQHIRNVFSFCSATVFDLDRLCARQKLININCLSTVLQKFFINLLRLSPHF